MRRDIQINTQTGDIVLKDQNSLDAYTFEWLEETDTHIRGQIIIPSSFDVRKIYTNGVCVGISYNPVYKPVQFRVLRKYDDSTMREIPNQFNNSEWYDVKAHLYGANESKQMYASEFALVSLDKFIVQLIENTSDVCIWSATQMDFNNINANIQNRNLLLKCVPSNNYRYPTSGVGMVRYLHGNIAQTNLASRLRSEFLEDDVVVNSASFDSYTGDLDLELDFSKADASI